MDLINRQAAIDEINRICPVDTEYDCVLLDRVDVICVLSDLPSAQPERKKGKWIVDEKRFGHTERHCNLCGAILEGDDWKWRNNYYCYHCGAEMEKDNEIN